MPNPELCTEADVTLLVHSFYDRVREDAALGPIFAAHVKNWDHHLATMVDFWSSALRGTARYRGAPLPKHAALPGLHIELFHQWLSLFRQTTQSLGHAGLQARADELAHSIAGSLWYGYLQRHAAERPVVDIADVRMQATRSARSVPIVPQRPTAHVAKRVEL
ncbi:preprotein translocase subunit TatC [Variovorax sp. WS11]|nr:group III truncated hemoglobin [Variovorax sp. WS11]PSL81353.1 preprotein translocase subunit TatC [Variovorax sp. WS11]